MQEQKNEKTRDIRERVALAFSTVVIGVAIVYWIIQIRGVMEMLEMAYG